MTNGVELTGFGIVVLALGFYLSIGKRMGTRQERPNFLPRAGGRGGQSSYEMVPVGDDDEERNEEEGEAEGQDQEEEEEEEEDEGGRGGKGWRGGGVDVQEEFRLGATEDENGESARAPVPEELRGIFWSGPSEGR